MFSPDQYGGTIAEIYSAGGLPVDKARIDRKAGAFEILRRLGDPGGEEPRPASITVHTRCEKLRETIPNLIHNPNDPEDVKKVDADEDGVGGDDAYDGFRYALMQAAKGDPGHAATAARRPAGAPRPHRGR